MTINRGREIIHYLFIAVLMISCVVLGLRLADANERIDDLERDSHKATTTVAPTSTIATTTIPVPTGNGVLCNQNGRVFMTDEKNAQALGCQ